MKPGSLLAAAVLASALFCPAQDKMPAAQAAAKPAVQDAAKPAVPDSYIIGASDNISITVFKEPTLSSSLLVRPDGMISMPLLGDVMAAGKTTLQLSDEITVKLKKYIQDPNVTVVLGQVNSKIVYLLGEVGKPGPIGMTPGMTFLQAIATAGGLTQFANSKKIYILRNDGEKHQKISVQYKRALKGDSSLNLDLNPGDTIVVP
jgi:polysaccharide export outer membrane protein